MEYPTTYCGGGGRSYADGVKVVSSCRPAYREEVAVMAIDSKARRRRR
jgi:hypothetical protein